MGSLRSCSSTASKLVIEKSRVGLSGYVSRFQSQINFPSCPHRRFSSVNINRSILAVVPPVSATPNSHSHSQVTETLDLDVDEQLTTARVKFQLRKACGFGDHFMIVGDDPHLGSWDTKNAITMEWSDGHMWTAEVDIPVDKTIQFKFVLKQSTGDIVWQPGPDRIFKTWTTDKIINVVEDWENSELQKLVEETVSVHDEEVLLKSDEKSIQETQQAENSLVDIAENNTFSEDSDSKNLMVAHNIVNGHRRRTLSEEVEDEEVILADPVLVPGLVLEY